MLWVSAHHSDISHYSSVIVQLSSTSEIVFRFERKQDPSSLLFSLSLSLLSILFRGETRLRAPESLCLSVSLSLCLSVSLSLSLSL